MKDLCGMQKRRWGGGRFYDHATVPPEAREKLFSFCMFIPIPGYSSSFRPTWVEQKGINFEEASLRIAKRFPGLKVPPQHLRGLWEEIPGE